MRGQLSVTSGPAAGRLVVLEPGQVYLVGRGEETQLRIPEDPALSRVHAELREGQAGWTLVNRSHHGTLVQGQVVQADVALVPGLEVQLGETRMVFQEFPVATAASAPPAPPAAPATPATAEPSSPGKAAGPLVLGALGCLVLLGPLVLGVYLLSGGTTSDAEPVAATRETPDPTPVAGSGSPSTPEPASSPAREAGTIGAAGGAIELPDGARFEVPPGAVGGEPSTTELLTVPVPETLPLGETLIGPLYAVQSETRLGVLGSFSLALPYDPAALGELKPDELGAVLVRGDLLLPVSSRVDAKRQRVVIEFPEVEVLAPPEIEPRRADLLRAELRKQFKPFYALQKRTAATLTKIQEALEKRIYRNPKHVFTIHNATKVPQDQAFVEFVSTLCERARTKLQKHFTAEGKAGPFSHLTSERRMEVWLGDYGTDGKYPLGTWSGHLLIDPTLAKADPDYKTTLENTVFHELFHGVQDHYRTLIAGGGSMWWFESSADWIGYWGQGVSWEGVAESKLDTFPYVLSVPIQESYTRDVRVGPLVVKKYEGYADGELAYSYSPLIGFVQGKSPKHLLEVLDSNTVLSSGYYAALVEHGKLAVRYPEFVHQILRAIDLPKVWWNGKLTHFRDKTVVTRIPMLPPGTPKQTKQTFTEESKRRVPFVFEGELGPLTTRFYQVVSAKVELAERLKVTLADGKGLPSDKAWIASSPDTKGGSIHCMRLDSSGTTEVPGLGSSLRTVWVAVYNDDPHKKLGYSLTLQLLSSDEERVVIELSTRKNIMRDKHGQGQLAILVEFKLSGGTPPFKVTCGDYTTRAGYEKRSFNIPRPRKAGPYPITLHVRDRLGQTASKTVEFEVEAIPSWTATLSGDLEGSLSLEFLFGKVQGSFDLGGQSGHWRGLYSRGDRKIEGLIHDAGGERIGTFYGHLGADKRWTGRWRLESAGMGGLFTIARDAPQQD